MIDATAEQVKNSWQGMEATADDFVSLDATLALAPRNEDFSLPENGFLRLTNSSKFIDKGENLGLPYAGSAPDLGAFETGDITETHQTRNIPLMSSRQIPYLKVSSKGKWVIKNPNSHSFDAFIKW